MDIDIDELVDEMMDGFIDPDTHPHTRAYLISFLKQYDIRERDGQPVLAPPSPRPAAEATAPAQAEGLMKTNPAGISTPAQAQDEARDDRGWPIRMDGERRVCNRPCCRQDEFRIDGYCSEYCRDVHELEQAEDEARGLLREIVDLDGAYGECISHEEQAERWKDLIQRARVVAGEASQPKPSGA